MPPPNLSITMYIVIVLVPALSHVIRGSGNNSGDGPARIFLLTTGESPAGMEGTADINMSAAADTASDVSTYF